MRAGEAGEQSGIYESEPWKVSGRAFPDQHSEKICNRQTSRYRKAYNQENRHMLTHCEYRTRQGKGQGRLIFKISAGKYILLNVLRNIEASEKHSETCKS